MKVYNQNGNKVRRSNSTVWYVVLLVVTVAIISLSITLAIVNSGKTDVSVDANINNNQPVTTKPINYELPFGSYTVAREASLNKLVYMPSLNMWKTHDGVDFLPGNDDKVKVMADGTVKNVEQSTLEGWIVTVDHGDGLISYYKSLSQVTVKTGDELKSGDILGNAGEMISERETGKHVHLELTKNGALVDPLDYLNTDTSK